MRTTGRRELQARRHLDLLQRKDGEFSLVGWNVDTNASRVEEGIGRDSLPDWRAERRAPLVRRALEEQLARRPHVSHIQEGRLFDTARGERVDSVTPVVLLFKEHYYGVILRPYNNGGYDKTFQFITAYDRTRMRVRGSYMRYFSETPLVPTHRPDTTGLSAEEAQAAMAAIKKNNFGVEWERGVLIARFDVDGLKEPLYSINVHFDLPEDLRLQSARLLCEFVQEILTESPNAKIVIEGDFNSFPDQGGAEQLGVLNEATTLEGEKLLNEASRYMTWANGGRASITFVAFPHDFIGVLGRDVHGVDIGQLIGELPSHEYREEARNVLKDVRGVFNLTCYLAQLQPACRREMIRAVFARCPALTSKLDHVFQHGFDRANCTLVPTPTYDTSDITSFNNDDEVKRYILDNFDKGPAFASDHQLVTATLV